MKELLKHLKSMIQLLKEEKQALIHNDGEKVSNIVTAKNECLNQLAKFKDINIEENKEIKELVEEIHVLQDLNLLLTKQALAYQNSILDSISKNMNSRSNTYSAKGNYESKNKASLIDKSL